MRERVVITHRHLGLPIRCAIFVVIPYNHSLQLTGIVRDEFEVGV